MNNLLLKKEAAKFRAENGLNGNDPIRLKSLLQKINVISVFAPLSESFSGMAIKAAVNNQISRFVLINSRQSLGKQHFTICHELYHLYIQPAFNSQVCITGRFDKRADKNEYNADVFASYLLLPTEGLLEFLPEDEIRQKRISLKTILFIENFYSSSRRALLYRLKMLGLITSEQYDSFIIHVKRGALENGYQTTLYEPGNDNVVVGNYGSLAKTLFDKEKISQSHYYSLLTDLGIDTRLLKDGAL
ncbi:MAG: ImmA/IrrE family metallo-endopeptidase [Chitinophagaceae bacterium]|nr:ImmA/IrrE family metallo-endopeptidase [Chitinophagaceae bacterium]